MLGADDVVLVQLRVHRADLPLTEGVVERVVDRRRRDTEARRGDAVDDQRDGPTTRLLIRRDVLELRQRLQLVDELRRPRVQFAGIGILERVLVLRTADAIVDRNRLDRLHVERDARDRAQL